MSGLAMYQSVQNQAGSDDLVLQNVALVKKIAYHLMNRLPPSVQTDDLIQSGMVGLIEAARNYDSTQGASFSTFAGIRIRGAMLDEIRRTDWTPRSVHKRGRMVSEAIRKIEHEHGRDAKDYEVAELLDISLDEYHQILKDSSSTKIFSVDDGIGGDCNTFEGVDEKTPGPFEGVTDADFKTALVAAIGNLPEREKLVISLYYDDEFNLKEIGQILEVSESRVCQILSQSTLRLRARMAEWTE
ncbi:MAG: RNA polymerase sigma factor FliA [Methylococcales bacterium]|nr:RNA polymerase sigma factor FliA [Methylococcales bacterium]